MTKIFAYLRVSTDAQDVANQRHGIVQYCASKQFHAPLFVDDTASGKTDWRTRALGNIISQAAPADVLVVSEVSRLARSTLQVLEIMRECVAKNVHLHVVKNGIVLDGRDIGTTVLPKADVKIFLTASVHTRAVRRFKELTEGHPEMSMEDVEKEISRRDYLDSHRDISPLKQAEDAVLLDNGDLTLEGTAEAIIHICRSRFPGFDA